MEFVKPTLKDIAEMIALVEPEVKKGVILPRSQEEMANTIRSYYVAKVEGRIVGFCALHIYSPSLAEVRSLIVKEEYRSNGIGKGLVELLLEEGKRLGIEEVLVLTYQERFFKALGFSVIEKEEIPNPKIWTDCIKCKHFPKCNEIALLKRI
ncbi:N-acetyltransferase [Helicobacter brantae]|uniref:N-acetyltransferase n=1 Tax=Helicobacter brantae TaxID=375927 RepID=A0A3D8J3U2_9HELI|nr:N-acetyltransferase [Helicobacter brantae]RDU72187.1 N-acetyltransferase [Helicobacter brantae]